MATFAQIEAAAVARLLAKGLQASEIDIGMEPTGLARPAVHCRITAVDYSRSAMSKYRAAITLSFIVFVKNVKSEKDRRMGVYPLVQGIVSDLMLQTLGLDIGPLVPLRAREVTDDELRTAGIIVYQVDFLTDSTITQEAESGDDLTKMAIDYLLKPGDDVADASDIIAYEEGN